MRTKLALLGLGAAVAAAVLPIATASAYCDPDTGTGGSGCNNSCVETGERYEAYRQTIEAKTGHKVALPSYWDIFLCPEYS